MFMSSSKRGHLADMALITAFAKLLSKKWTVEKLRFCEKTKKNLSQLSVLPKRVFAAHHFGDSLLCLLICFGGVGESQKVWLKVARRRKS